MLNDVDYAQHKIGYWLPFLSSALHEKKKEFWIQISSIIFRIMNLNFMFYDVPGWFSIKAKINEYVLLMTQAAENYLEFIPNYSCEVFGSLKQYLHSYLKLHFIFSAHSVTEPLFLLLPKTYSLDESYSIFLNKCVNAASSFKESWRLKLSVSSSVDGHEATMSVIRKTKFSFHFQIQIRLLHK